MRGSVFRAALLAFAACLAAGADAGRAQDGPAPGETDVKDLVRALGAADANGRAAVADRLLASPHAAWAAGAALECVAAAEDRLSKALAERDKQGARMFQYFERTVARNFENRAKFTEFRMMEVENRTLCGAVQQWAATLDRLRDAARALTEKASADAAAADAVAARARRLMALSSRPSQQGAVLASVRGDAARRLVADAHAVLTPTQDREVAVPALRVLELAPEAVEAERLRPAAEHSDHAVRRVAFRTLAAAATAPAMDLLVERAEVEEGVPAAELVRHLHALTQETFGLNPAAWRAWWTARRATWQREGARVDQAERIEREPYSRYFGLEIRSARVLFVLDRSGSMADPVGAAEGSTGRSSGDLAPKMSVAVRELTSAITALDERSSFNVLAYGTAIDAFARRPVRATRENRERASKWAAKLVPDGQTNLAGSLLAAFENTRPAGSGTPTDAVADTIVILSDGAPNCGPIAYDDDVLAELRRLNAEGWVTIHSVFLGNDGDEEFMRSLAEEHGGRFVHHAR